MGSTSARRPSSEISVQLGPCTSASSSTNGTPSRSASCLPTVVLPLPLALAVTETRLTGAKRLDARAGGAGALQAGQQADHERDDAREEHVHRDLPSLFR